VVALSGISLLLTPVFAEEVTLEPVKDTTIYEDEQGSLSNGSGDFLFAGVNGSNGGNRIMRGLIAFDLSSIPPGSIIESVTLLMRQSLPRSDGVSREVSLHRVLRDWGEGASNAEDGEAGGAPASAGDATWLHTSFSDSQWAIPGGDFQSEASASVGVGGNGFYQWLSTNELVADVQAWTDDPDSNYGWLVKGQESLNGASFTARRFDSRHATAVNSRPNLIIEFTSAEEVSRPEIVFPQYVTGNGDSTRVVLRNNSETAATGSISFLDENGDSAQVSIGGALTDSVRFELEPWGSTDITTDPTGDLTAGAIEVFVETDSASDLEGTEVFFHLGRYVSVTGARPAKMWQAYVSRNSGEGSGLAVQNPDRIRTATLKMALLDSSGMAVASEDLILLPGQRIAEFLGESEFFKDYFEQNPDDFAGTLNIEVIDGPDVALVGLIQKKPGGDLIAIEATNNPFVN
jgi:hypothetical protein